MFHVCGGKTPWRIEPNFFLEEDITDVITCFKFGDDRFRGFLPFPIDFDGRPYNTLTLPCKRVIIVYLCYVICYMFMVK